MNWVFNWGLDPVFFNFFGLLPVRYYSILFGLGIFLSFSVFGNYIKTTSLKNINVDSLVVFLFLGMMIGMRLGHCIFYDTAYYWNHPWEAILPMQYVDGVWEITGYLGLASHGGAIGILLAIFYFCTKEGIGFLALFDKIAIVIPLACVFIRWGNFMNSEIIGVPTNGSFGIIFERVDLLPRHPVQLYEAFSYLFIFVILYMNRKRWDSRNGLLFGLMLVFVFTARFLIEFAKIDQSIFDAGMSLNMGQVLSLPFILCGCLLIWNSRKNFHYLEIDQCIIE